MVADPPVPERIVRVCKHLAERGWKYKLVKYERGDQRGPILILTAICDDGFVQHDAQIIWAVEDTGTYRQSSVIFNNKEMSLKELLSNTNLVKCC